MSTFDPFAEFAAEFDEPVAPRPEFATALAERLFAELRVSSSSAGRLSTSRSWAWSLLSMRPRARVVLAAIVVMLLFAGVATATYLGVHAWVSASPRGPQATGDYRLTTVYRAPRSTWMDVYPAAALSVDGRDLFLAHQANNSTGAEEILRISGVSSGRPTPARQILDLHTVSDPVFFDGAAWGGLSTSPNGDLFVIGASRTRGPLAMSVLVVHPDGSRQTVVTYRELRRAGLIPRGLPAFASDDGSFSVAASAPDRLWLRARVLRRPYSDGWPYDVTNALFEVIDPNDDGNWSDRVIRRVTLPAWVPGFKGHGRSRWLYGALVAEPAPPGAEHSDSVLLQATGLLGQASGGPRSLYRVVRVSDFNDDGDVSDPGEARQVFQGEAAASQQLASRLSSSGGHTRRELVIAGGLTRPDRITIVSSTGQVYDIGRSFPGWGPFDALLTDSVGDILPVLGFDEDANGMQRRIYKLHPISSPSRHRVPAPGLRSIPEPPGSGPLLAVTLADPGSPTISGSSYWVRPDGTHRSPIAGHAGSLCQSTAGRTLAFTSDLEVPREGFVYTAIVGGGAPNKISEQPLTPVCPFDGRWLILSSQITLPDGPAWTLVRHDMRTGQETGLIKSTTRYTVSPDGRQVAYVERTERGQSLVVVDVPTLRSRRIAGAILGTSYAPSTSYSYLTSGTTGDDLQWSPDGTQLAFVTGRPFDYMKLSWSNGSKPVKPRRYEISTVRIQGNAVRRIATIDGGPPTLAWSPDGTQLLVCAAVRGPETGCGNHNPHPAWLPDGVGGSVLHLIGHDGSDRIVARGPILFAAWRPNTNGFAWADDQLLHFSTTRRTLPVSSVGGAWVGWSPDGQYLTLGPKDGFTVLDTKTGKSHTLVRVAQDYMVQSVKWWNP